MADQTMTDAFISGGQLGASQAASATNSAANWATSMHDVAFKKAQAERDQQRLEMDQFNHNAAKGALYIKQAGTLAGMQEGPLKKAAINKFNEFWTNAGIEPDETTLASFSDPTAILHWKQIAQAFPGIKNPDLAGQAAAGMANTIGQETTLEFLQKASAQGAEILSTQNRIQNTREIADRNFSGRTITNAVKIANSATSNDEKVFRVGANLSSIAKLVRDGKLVGTAQVLNTLNQEKTKIDLGSGVLAQGSLERGRSETYAQSIANLITKITTMPKDAKIGDIAKQIETESQDVMKNYMKDIDSQHDQLRDEFQQLPEGQRAIDAKFNALRRNVADKGFIGRWEGNGNYDIKPGTNSAAKSGNATTPLAPAPKSFPMAAQAGTRKVFGDYQRAMKNQDEAGRQSALNKLRMYEKAAPGLLQSLGIQIPQ